MEHRRNASDDHKVKHYFQTNQTPIPIVPAPHGHHHRHPLPNPPHQTRLDHKLQQFWAKQNEEARLTTDFKAHGLPLARIKKIVKSEDKVKMVGSEVPVILAKACEMFIQELTLRSWDHTEEKKRRTLQRGDVAIAVEKTDVFDFLVDIVPRERYVEEEVEIRQRGGGGGGGFGRCPCEGASAYSYMPPPLPAFVGNPTGQPMWQPPPPSFVVNAHDAAQSYVAQSMWSRPPLPPPPPSFPVVNVRDAAQSRVWPQPPPPVPSFVEDPAVNVPHAAQSYSYIARPVWPQTPPPYAGGSTSYQQG